MSFINSSIRVLRNFARTDALIGRNLSKTVAEMGKAVKSKLTYISSTELPPSKTFHFSNLMHHRSFCYASSDPFENIILITSVAELQSALRKVQEECYPAVFNFIEELPKSCVDRTYGHYKKLFEKYPHVAFYTVCPNVYENVPSRRYAWGLDDVRIGKYYLLKNGEVVDHNHIYHLRSSIRKHFA